MHKNLGCIQDSFIYETLTFDSLGGEAKNADNVAEDISEDTEMIARNCENSAVFSSLPLAIKWLRDSVQRNQSVRFQVILGFQMFCFWKFTTCLVNNVSSFEIYLKLIHVNNIFFA